MRKYLKGYFSPFSSTILIYEEIIFHYVFGGYMNVRNMVAIYISMSNLLSIE